ncbi:MAG: A/G-specific adenine glycosylase [Coprobacter sp.]|nr:A/G-specific adenine glycosylase [Coprobacter sp.]
MPEYKTISRLLCQWFDEHKRQLPWRETTDAYHIWVSEIILQQTRVVQGYDYYLRFIERFPDVATLAEAQEAEVLKYWEGLGYYSRARNLHHAARQIVNEHDGVFPHTYDDIRALKGVGDYTAAAIASFAYDLPHAVVDGNVYRVLSRLFAIDTPIDSTAGKRLFAGLADELLDRKNPSRHNQALMELGALLCLPRNAQCDTCPLLSYCEAAATGRANELPVKAGKTVVRPRYFNYIVIQHEDHTFIHQRCGRDIWRNLYEYILIESDKELTFGELQECGEYRALLSDVGDITIALPAYSLRHVLSHRVIHATFHTLQIVRANDALSAYLRVPLDAVERYAFARLTGLYHEYVARF